jgi:D-serine deaminase-like pyridoxal phosphate-dependent protein
MTYAKPGTRRAAADYLSAARDGAAKAGLETTVISSGGSPDMWKDEGLGALTEYRVGTYIYFDRSLAERQVCSYDDCAVTILATVVSVPTPERALLDAGSKSLTSDLLGMTGYGTVRSLDGATVYDLSEEHGFLDLSRSARKPKVGERLRIVPNHVCPVINLFDRVVVVDGEDVLGAVRVDARGLVQ